MSDTQTHDTHIPTTVHTLRETFDAGVTKPLAWRTHQLEQLDKLLTEHEDRIADALAADLGKHPIEAYLTETSFLKNEIRHTVKNLKRWTKPRYVTPNVALLPAITYSVAEPLGVALIIAPWNYPVQLLLAPAIGAIAAGNAVLLKPSEVAPASAHLLAELIPQYLDSRAVAVVEGGVEETTQLLAQRFDHIFYTGNATVGRIVMRAAAEHLTPVTLELGGKSPLYIDDSVDLETAADRIVWGKFTNAGQTCVAPDYILAQRHVADALVVHLENSLQRLYGPVPRLNEAYGKIINERHYDRLHAHITDLTERGVKVISTQDNDRQTCHLDPVIAVDVPHDASIMGEEIFGPILPIRIVDGPKEAINEINTREKPLALYVFSERREVRRAFLRDTSSGALTFGLPIGHVAATELPFGGVGESGMGGYHGRFSFDTFSHLKPVVSKPLSPDTMRMVYPPYAGERLAWMRRILG
ncbi:aldehyde dehydrogenase family protein [Jonesia quinghaiensis]|uniref:aldehyde dehydrogenase family protein n=1 Tax=Jonesia quinghaiensis TaxID=262806 RepID=UPI000416A798|nr:aldehyde dehydrogenase family protein [Jonesia quinghaiensis]